MVGGGFHVAFEANGGSGHATGRSPLAIASGDGLPAADYEVGQALICDTRAQAERFVALFNGDASSAVGVVNAEQHDPTECGIVDAAYVRGPSLGLARNGDNAVEIIRLLVIGVKSQSAIRAVNPAAYFSLLRVKEFAV
jgi:hypothetical protein